MQTDTPTPVIYPDIYSTNTKTPIKVPTETQIWLTPDLGPTPTIDKYFHKGSLPIEYKNNFASQRLPQGIMVYDEKRRVVDLYNLNFQINKTVPIQSHSPIFRAIASKMDLYISFEDIPILYIRDFEKGKYELEEQLILSQKRGTAEISSILFKSRYLLEIVGSPGEQVILISQSEESDESYITNTFYTGDYSSINQNITPIYIESPDTYLIEAHPLAINVQKGKLTGFFFTRLPAIQMGDIAFGIQHGLFYFDALQNKVVTVLPKDRNPVGISPDLQWAASTNNSDFDLQLINVFDGRTIFLQLNENSNRGAGTLIFSPGNDKVAWQEGSGWLDTYKPDFASRIRVATIQGKFMWDITSSQLPKNTCRSTLALVPEGFLTNNSFIIQGWSSYSNDRCIFKADIEKKTITLVGEGNFIGFYY